MKNLIVMKSYQNGISILMDPDVDFEEIIAEIADKFKNSRTFFKDVKVALSLEGRVLSAEEERRIINTITDNSDVEILCLVGKNEETNKKFVKALKRVEYEKDENKGRFYRGNLKEGQTLETDSSIIIVGNVEKGAAIIASKDIIIIGGLYGEAYAGASGEEGHFVLALHMEPEKCKIGEHRLRQKEKGKWPIKQKIQPQIAYCKEEQVVVETVTKELPNF